MRSIIIRSKHSRSEKRKSILSEIQQLKIEGTPVYLDVEGLPDHDFYYLIGMRIRNGESVVQHSLWADNKQEEKINLE